MTTIIVLVWLVFCFAVIKTTLSLAEGLSYSPLERSGYAMVWFAITVCLGIAAGCTIGMLWVGGG